MAIAGAGARVFYRGRSGNWRGRICSGLGLPQANRIQLIILQKCGSAAFRDPRLCTASLTETEKNRKEFTSAVLDSMAENGGRMVDVWAVNAVRSTTGTAPYAERF
jgi:hypothetical protein